MQKRKIPSTLFTQHPDNASAPFWSNQKFITTEMETEESYICFSQLNAPEIKWDWEGKLVDESFLEKLFAVHYDYFKKNQIGRDKFITYRLPNPTVETKFRLGRAFMGLISAASLAKKSGLKSPPLFEVILPMTQTAEELIDIQEAFKEISQLKHKLYKPESNELNHIEMIPLIEEIHSIMDSDQLIKRYLNLHKEKFGFIPSYMRPYIARSDPALNAGIVPTVLAIKIALSRFNQLEKETGVNLYPMLGCAALPFRGGLTPLNVDDFVNEYSGMKTVTIQSAFRYDYPKQDVISAINKLDELLPQSKSLQISVDEESIIKEIISEFETSYKTIINNSANANLINKIAEYIPKRRERVLHTGLFGYSRGVGEIKLPRAIKFTGSLYSIGMPPEIIGTGRGLKRLSSNDQKSLLKKYYVNFKQDMIRAGSYLNKNVLDKLAKTQSNWLEVKKDVEGIEEFIGEELKPQSPKQKEHFELSDRIFNSITLGENPSELIEHAAILRKSIG